MLALQFSVYLCWPWQTISSKTVLVNNLFLHYSVHLMCDWDDFCRKKENHKAAKRPAGEKLLYSTHKNHAILKLHGKKKTALK